MNFNTIIAYLRQNWIISLILGGLAFFVLFGRQLRRVFNPVRRRRVRRVKPTIKRARRVRSVRAVRGSAKGYPKVGGGYIALKRNKDGSIKKGWQVAGTVAAKRRMSKLRRAR